MADFESAYVIHSKGEKAAELAARLAKEPDMESLQPHRAKSRSDDLRADRATEDVAAAEAASTEAKKAAPLDARKAAVAEAVNSASPENKKDVAKEAMESLPSAERQELANQFTPTQAVTDQVWLTVVGTFKWVLWGATLGLVGISGLAAFRDVDLANILILLTVFTTVAGIFAGFLGGKAVGTTGTTESLIWAQIFKAFRWVLVVATIALVTAVGVAFFREVDQVLILTLLTVFTTVAGILAGFISGQATSEKGRDI